MTYFEQKAFDDIKRTVTCNTLLKYLDFNKRFFIHTDARDYHMGAMISQGVKPIDFYNR